MLFPRESPVVCGGWLGRRTPQGTHTPKASHPNRAMNGLEEGPPSVNFKGYPTYAQTEESDQILKLLSIIILVKQFNGRWCDN